MSVKVNGQLATIVSRGAGVVDWSAIGCSRRFKVAAFATDDEGNIEQTPHIEALDGTAAPEQIVHGFGNLLSSKAKRSCRHARAGDFRRSWKPRNECRSITRQGPAECTIAYARNPMPRLSIHSVNENNPTINKAMTPNAIPMLMSIMSGLNRSFRMP